MRLTGSALGYLHYVNREENGFDSYVWSKGAAEACAAREYMDFSLASAGLWADCMRKRGPVTCNDYPAFKEKKGLPEGHIPIQRIMSIPIMKNEKWRPSWGSPTSQRYTTKQINVSFCFSETVSGA